MRRGLVVLPLCASFAVAGSALPAASAAPTGERPALTALISPEVYWYAGFGQDAAAMPDVDGDGGTDVIVSGAGQQTLYSGATGQLLWPITTPSGGGGVAAGVPDTDGDGLGDVILGTLETVNGESRAGRAYLMSGATGELLHTFTATRPQENGEFGWSVAGLPDIDGDGRGEVVIGSPGEGTGRREEGAAYVYSGATGARLRILRAPVPDLRLGVSTTPTGDLDGDGVTDLMVSSWHGPTFVFAGANGRVLLTLEEPETLDPEAGPFGHDTAVVPDLNGDGTRDLAVTSPGYGEGMTEGSAVTYSGATGAVLEIYRGNWLYSNFGSAVAGADLDGDGAGELLVAADGTDGASPGHIYVFDGSSCHRLDGDTQSDDRESDLGTALQNLGDLDGDGRDDLVVGAAGVDRGPDLDNAGAAWLVKSDSSDSTADLLRSLAGGLSGRVSPC